MSYERQFWGESSFRAAYVRKQVRDEFATYNILRENQFTVPVAATVVMRSFDGGIAGNQVFNVFDIPDALRGQVRNVVATIPDSVGGGDFDYDTIQLAFNKRFSRDLFIQSSFDYQWRDELRQNSASNSPLNSDPLGINYYQNVFPTVSNRQESTNWQGRLMGRYLFPYDLGFAVNLRVQSGWAWARLIQATLPNSGTQTFFMEDIDNNRSERVALLDLRWDKSVRFGKYRAMVIADLFNALSSNAVINFNLTNGANFNRINATLDPRTFMLGFRFDF